MNNHGHTHGSEEVKLEVILQFDRAEGGSIFIPINEIGLFSTFTTNMAPLGEPPVLEHHEDQTLIFVKCANLNVVVQATPDEVMRRLLLSGVIEL